MAVAKFFIAGLLVLVFATPTMAGLYKCVDKQSRTFYQDKPCQEMAVAKLPNSLSKMSGHEESSAFFWKATGGKGTLYLLGTLHFGVKSMYPLPQLVNTAFNNSNVLMVEANINNLNIKEIADLVQQQGRYSDDGKLEDHIKSLTWNKTLEAAAKLGITEDSLHSTKPWLAALILTNQKLVQEGYVADLGVDISFVQQAQGKKPVMELENVQDQINLFNQFSDQEQEQMLLHTLSELNKGPEFDQSILNAWKIGDAEEMDLIVRQSFDSGQLSTKLFKLFIVDRSERMANRLADLANDGRTYFVVVGSAHLGGEKGILKLLEQKGFKITQP